MERSGSKKFGKAIVSIILTMSIFSTTVVSVFASSGNISKTVLESSTEVAKQIEGEGIVMLKNDDNSLPLTTKKVNVFGSASVNLSLGGGGSGSVIASDAINFFEGLDDAGIEYNNELLDIYKDWKTNHSIPETGQGLVDMLLQNVNSAIYEEMPVSSISSSAWANAVDYSDTAVIVLSRTGSEMSDLSVSDLQLKDAEVSLISEVNSRFSNVIVIFNTCNIMELDWVKSYSNIKSLLLVWAPGEVGADSIGEVLSGKINPSGKLPDTVANKITDYPTTANFGNFAYSDATLKYFVNYSEGIYVGYRYFETFAPEKVLYPFGYGLSYTSFDWEVTDYSADSDKITVNVKVTNTGDTAGKDVVEVYFSAPYKSGGIEKSAIELGGYVKTDMINPGKSETVTVSFDTDDMASYDYKGSEAWVLEAGKYQIKVGHSVRDITDTFDYTVDETKTIKNDTTTGTEINNLFDDVAGSLTYLSRSSGTGSIPSAPTDYTAPASVKNCDTRPAASTGTVPKAGVTYSTGTILLADVAENPMLWDNFLNQLTVDEMIVMVTESGYKTAGISRLGIPETVDNDGPATVKGDNGLLYEDSGVAYPIAFALASTWSDKLAEEFGISAGKEAADIGTNIWYAPACNLHRNPLGGRNFEYYSEDPLLSGKMAAAVAKGAQSQNLIVTVKHFACNDQETNRQTNGVFTWCNEQALRELYFKPFEIAVKEGGAKGIMSAYNRLGATWCGASSPLLRMLLRDEWGFDGFVVSDAYMNFTGNGYMDPVLAIYARNDALLTSLWYAAQKTQITQSIKSAYESDPVGMGNALRECAYDLCQVKMLTSAFDPTATSANIAANSTTAQVTTTTAANGSGSAEEKTAAGDNGQDIKDVSIAKTGRRVVSILCIGIVTAAAAAIIPNAARKRKEKENEK